MNDTDEDLDLSHFMCYVRHNKEMAVRLLLSRWRWPRSAKDNGSLLSRCTEAKFSVCGWELGSYCCPFSTRGQLFLKITYKTVPFLISLLLYYTLTLPKMNGTSIKSRKLVWRDFHSVLFQCSDIFFVAGTCNYIF